MPSNKETLFQDHICAFLKDAQQYVELTADDLHDREYHFIEKTPDWIYQRLSAQHVCRGREKLRLTAAHLMSAFSKASCAGSQAKKNSLYRCFGYKTGYSYLRSPQPTHQMNRESADESGWAIAILQFSSLDVKAISSPRQFIRNNSLF
jgi:hypothetical protein